MSGATEAIGMVTIGTASKGIIDRNFQHNAQVYRQMYAPNPFASETDEDIAKYMNEVQAKRPPNSTNGQGPHCPDSPSNTESPNAETISLMQAARENRRRDSGEVSTSPRKATAMSASASKELSSSGGGGPERLAASDDENREKGSSKKEKKKRKSLVPGFLRPKKKEATLV